MAGYGSIFVPEFTYKVIEEFDGEYLIDVFRIWDCCEQDWADRWLTLFRFEYDDVLVWSDTGKLRCRKGAIDNRDVSFEMLRYIGTGEDCYEDLSWIRDRRYKSKLGKQNKAKDLLLILIWIA